MDFSTSLSGQRLIWHRRGGALKNAFFRIWFIKNKIECKIATSDGRCTIGFVDARQYLRPKTILANNHLDHTKPIYLVKPFFVACLKI